MSENDAETADAVHDKAETADAGPRLNRRGRRLSFRLDSTRLLRKHVNQRGRRKR